MDHRRSRRYRSRYETGPYRLTKSPRKSKSSDTSDDNGLDSGDYRSYIHDHSNGTTKIARVINAIDQLVESLNKLINYYAIPYDEREHVPFPLNKEIFSSDSDSPSPPPEFVRVLESYSDSDSE